MQGQEEEASELFFCCDNYLQFQPEPMKCKNIAYFETVHQGVMLCMTCASIFIEKGGKEIQVGPYYGRAFQLECMRQVELNRKNLN